MNPSLRQLESFVVLASTLNFRRAAELLHVTQPALSVQIKRLERQLGIELFTRTTRTVALTDAGHALQSELAPVLQSLDRVIDGMRSWADGTTGVLNVGYLIGAGPDTLPRLLREFATSYPSVRVETNEYDFGHPTAGLDTGEVDIAIIRPPVDFDGLDYLPISEEGWVACLPQDHRLTEYDSLKIEQVLEEPIIAAPQSAGAWRDYWIAQEYRSRAPAHVAGEAATFEAEFTAVAQGRGISITTATAAQFYRRPGIRFVPIIDAPPCIVALAWVADALSPQGEMLVSTVRQMPLTIDNAGLSID